MDPEALPKDPADAWVGAIALADPAGQALAALVPPPDLPSQPALPWRLADAAEPLDVTLSAEALGADSQRPHRAALRGVNRVGLVLVVALLLTVDAVVAAVEKPIPRHALYLAVALGLTALVGYRLWRRLSRVTAATS